MNPTAFYQLYNANKPVEDDSNIVFICRVGIRSNIAIAIAKDVGYERCVYQCINMYHNHLLQLVSLQCLVKYELVEVFLSCFRIKSSVFIKLF